MITGHTRVCGLIGNPVEHTSSPAIHNSLAEHFGHDLVYVPFRVDDGGIEAAVKGAYALNILGMNVTVPYKLDVIPYLVEIDELAKRIGAVNTLVRVDGGFKGYNTDLLGLERALINDGADIKGKCAVILGAGGAARSVAFLCERMQAESVYILNRTIAKAKIIADEVNAFVGREYVKACSLEEYTSIPADKFIAIQATSVGLSPHDEEVIISDMEFYKRVTYGFDLIYKPADTMFMKLARDCGAKVSNGLSMLLYQGIIAYELWNKISVSEEVSRQVYSILEGTVRS